MLPTRELTAVVLYDSSHGIPLLRLGRRGAPPTARMRLSKFPLIAYDISSPIKSIVIMHGGVAGCYQATVKTDDALLEVIKKLKNIAANEARGFPFRLIDLSTQ